jgi:hypothetical protein
MLKYRGFKRNLHYKDLSYIHADTVHKNRYRSKKSTSYAGRWVISSSGPNEMFPSAFIFVSYVLLFSKHVHRMNWSCINNSVCSLRNERTAGSYCLCLLSAVMHSRRTFLHNVVTLCLSNMYSLSQCAR